MTHNTENDVKKNRNEMLDAIDEKLDEVGDAASDVADDTSNWLNEQRDKLKGVYHDAVADNADDLDEKFEHRMKATKEKAKAAGRKLS